MRSGYSSRILLISSVPMPEPVPPPSEWQTWNPARQEPRMVNNLNVQTRMVSNLNVHVCAELCTDEAFALVQSDSPKLIDQPGCAYGCWVTTEVPTRPTYAPLSR